MSGRNGELSKFLGSQLPCPIPEAPPDFLFINCSLAQPSIKQLAPASYARTLLHLRWAAQSIDIMGSNALHYDEATALTLHSMKSTMLAAAAQLAIAREDRLAQGHHRDSAIIGIIGIPPNFIPEMIRSIHFVCTANCASNWRWGGAQRAAWHEAGKRRCQSLHLA